MSEGIKRLFSRTVALAFGLLWGLFVAFNVVFSDIAGVNGMLGAILYVLAAYAGLGLAFGVVGAHTGIRWSPWLAVPGALFALLMLSDNPARLAYTLGVALSVVAATVAGTFAGSLARRRIDAWAERRRVGSGPAAPAGS